MNVDTTFTIPCAYMANRYRAFAWWVTKNNIQQRFSQNIYVSPFDTAFLNINY